MTNSSVFPLFIKIEHELAAGTADNAVSVLGHSYDGFFTF